MATNDSRLLACGLRIVVADDDRDAVLTLSALLQAEGHTVIEVCRARFVVDLVLRYKPDAVLLDIGMPEVTGFEIARQLRDKFGLACPLLVAITGWDQDKARQLGKLFGFNHYLIKPYLPEELMELLSALTVSGQVVD